jgi:hypothetical protein
MFSSPFTFPPILTISSPVFSEFVLELGILSAFPSWEHQDYWEGIDGFLEQRYAKHGGFKLIIRQCESHFWDTLQTDVKEAFPLLESRGCIRFDIPQSLTGK